MRKIDGSTLGIAQGSLVLFSDFKDGGVMWTGEGPRELRRAVRFDEGFRAAPAVQIGLSMWDMDQQTNARADIAAEDVTPQGFTIVFRTWADTRIARVRADWLALGEARGDDDWDVD